jgi:hypothetical protein
VLPNPPKSFTEHNPNSCNTEYTGKSGEIPLVITSAICRLLISVDSCFAGPGFNPSVTMRHRTVFTGCGKIPKVSFRGRGLPEESAFFLGLVKKQIPRFARDDIKLLFSAASLAAEAEFWLWLDRATAYFR